MQFTNPITIDSSAEEISRHVNDVKEVDQYIKTYGGRKGSPSYAYMNGPAHLPRTVGASVILDLRISDEARRKGIDHSALDFGDPEFVALVASCK
jgi:hypothetical protein